MPGYASLVFALELVGPAGDVLAVPRRFVFAIGAVFGAVAHPVGVNARYVVVALELLGQADGRAGGGLEASLKYRIGRKRRLIARKFPKELMRTCSSLASAQSTSPSHCQRFVMQYLGEHWNSVSGEQLTFGQFFSSELSPQSSSKSHTQPFCMHFPFPHVNSSDLHVSSGKRRCLGIGKMVAISNIGASDARLFVILGENIRFPNVVHFERLISKITMLIRADTIQYITYEEKQYTVDTIVTNLKFL